MKTAFLQRKITSVAVSGVGLLITTIIILFQKSLLASDKPYYPGFVYITGITGIILVVAGFGLLYHRLATVKENNNLLHRQLNNLFLTLNKLREGLIMVNGEGNIKYANKTAAALCGYETADMLNRPVEEVYHITDEATGQKTENIVRNILNKKLYVLPESNTILHSRINEKKIIYSTAVALYDSDRELEGVSLIFGETAGLKEKQKKQEGGNITAGAAGDTVWNWNLVHEKMVFNENITKMFGYEMSKEICLPGWWKSKIHPPDYPGLMAALEERMKKEEKNFQVEYRFLCKDGTCKFIADSISVFYGNNKKPLHISGSMKDVSHLKEMEKRIDQLVVQAQERERQKIGMELHDNIKQILTSSLMYMGMAATKKNDDEKSLDCINKSKILIQESITELRKLSHQLAPASFKNISLSALTEALIQTVAVANKWKVDLNFENTENIALNHDIKITLYRILQEQLDNISRYAAASAIHVAAKIIRGRIILSIKDNGKGFDVSKIKPGIGLENIQRRVTVLSGKKMIRSSPGQGCELTVELPLRQV